jgi:hypothetical protein
MQKMYLRIFLILFWMIPAFAFPQQWDFVKEKDGIKIYTRKENNSDIKSFKGVADVHCPVEKINNMIGNPTNTDWWSKNVKEVKVLSYEREKFNRMYIVYDLPWPLTDRDLCVEATIKTDPVTKIRTVTSVPIANVVPEKKDLVRIKKYWQQWTIQPAGPNTTHLIIEGTVDPAGSIPAWLYNMVITETPLKIIDGIKEKVEK